MAFLAPIIMTFLVGMWEVGRYLMVQNLLDNTAREAARQAASGSYFSSNNHTSPTAPHPTVTLPPPSQNTDYEVQQRALLSLKNSGVPTTGATVTVANSGSSSSTTKNWSYTWTENGANPTTGTGSGSGYDPSAVADQLDMITVTVTLPYNNVGWSFLGWFVKPGTTMTASASWVSVRDIPLTISTTIPSKPLQPSDPLP
jgi:Flp pilus assembly protein TadG